MTSNTSWYSTFFSGVAVDVQRRLASPEQTQAEADFLERHLRLQPGARLADVPCGEGRLSIELASRGHTVTAVDISEELAADARTAAAARALPVEVHVRDMRDLPWESQFDGLFCFGNSFAYLGDEGDAAFLRAVYRALKPGGRFALETGVAAESILTVPRGRSWYRLGEALLFHETHYDARAAQLRSDYVFMHGGRTEEKTAFYRVYLLRQLVQLLESIGFTEVEEMGGLDGATFKLGSPRLYLTATKG